MFATSIQAAMLTQDAANALYREHIAPLLISRVDAAADDDYDVAAILASAQEIAESTPGFYDEMRQSISGMAYVAERGVTEMAWELAEKALRMIRDGRVELNRTSIDLPHPPRELDAKDDTEKLVAALIPGDALVLWRHDFDWSGAPVHLLLLAASEDGPRILGVTSWMGSSERQARVRMDVSLDEISRPMIPDRSETGMVADPIHHTDPIGQAFEKAIPGANGGLRLHFNDGTSAWDGTYVSYFGRVSIDGVKHFVAGHAERRRDGETNQATEIQTSIGFLLPIAELKSRLSLLANGEEPRISIKS